MFDNTSLDQFSLLDELPSVTPVWRPFVQDVPAILDNETQNSEQRAHYA